SARERAVAPNSARLVEAVAANLFKLSAYKDEYEVARLMTDADGLAAAREVAGSRGKIAWKLHPPLLSAMDRVLAALSAEKLDAAVKLAELPDLVRGYEEIKLARVESYRQRLREAV